MTYPTSLAVRFLVCLVMVVAPLGAQAVEVIRSESYFPMLTEIERHKKFYDDPRPMLLNFGPKKVLPSQLYERLSFDIEEMKVAWADVVGFRAPDVVGRIAPQIAPGRYAPEDVRDTPEFKELMTQFLYERVKAGGPPYVGCIPVFEIIPTRQYYFSLPVARKSKEADGRSQLDEKGYLVPESWQGGYPFPKPSGEFKAQQIMYNLDKRYLFWSGNYEGLARIEGYTNKLVKDNQGVLHAQELRLAGRLEMEPLGWFDRRAEERGEFKTYAYHILAPRDMKGAVQSALYYLDPAKTDQLMMYVPFQRRTRNMTGTDSQDPLANADFIYDDSQGFSQKLSPKRYPYTYEVIGEREYLVRAPTLDGSPTVCSKGLGIQGAQFERRPIYVVKLTQLDPNYVYGHRILYIDKETFNFYQIENYDQNGRLYRTFESSWAFFAEMGQITWCGAINVAIDHLETHSSVAHMYSLPAFFGRSDFGLEGISGKAK